MAVRPAHGAIVRVARVAPPADGLVSGTPGGTMEGAAPGSSENSGAGDVPAALCLLDRFLLLQAQNVCVFGRFGPVWVQRSVALPYWPLRRNVPLLLDAGHPPAKPPRCTSRGGCHPSSTAANGFIPIDGSAAASVTSVAVAKLSSSLNVCLERGGGEHLLHDCTATTQY